MSGCLSRGLSRAGHEVIAVNKDERAIRNDRRVGRPGDPGGAVRGRGEVA
jgi:hypothetical protein